MTDYFPFHPSPARLWAVEMVGLDPMRPLPRLVWAVQWTATPGEALQRTAWQAQAEGDLPTVPYTWLVTPHEPVFSGAVDCGLAGKPCPICDQVVAH